MSWRPRRRRQLLAALALIALLHGLTSCARVPPRGSAAAPSARPGATQRGGASWYGPTFHGRTTANGERYNMLGLTAAHRSLPFNTYVQVTSMASGRRLVVRINDRGPFVRGRIIDLSYAAAKILDIPRAGVVPVRIEVLEAARGERLHRRQTELVRSRGVRGWSQRELEQTLGPKGS